MIAGRRNVLVGLIYDSWVAECCRSLCSDSLHHLADLAGTVAASAAASAASAATASSVATVACTASAALTASVACTA